MSVSGSHRSGRLSSLEAVGRTRNEFVFLHQFLADQKMRCIRQGLWLLVWRETGDSVGRGG